MLPLTHRDWSSAVSFVAGQCKGLSEQDWSGLAGKGRTLVIYMGVATADAIADKLMADGVAPDMPVAVLETRHARTARARCAPCSPISARWSSARRSQSPAIIVVGEVVLLSDAEDRLAALGQACGGAAHEDPDRQRSARPAMSSGGPAAAGRAMSRTRSMSASTARRSPRARKARAASTAPYVIDATATPEGPRPAHIKDRIRALGPDRAPRSHAQARRPERRQLGDLTCTTTTNTTRRSSMPASRNSATRSRAASPGALTEDQFKPLRLKNGLYLQLHAYMLRVAIPYGTLDSRQMRMLGAYRAQI